MNNISALYVHIPFCDSICSYCDFYKMRAKSALKSRYIAFLCKEVDLYAEGLKAVTTVYIGGGSPLSLEVSLLKTLLDKLFSILNASLLEEFTIEANPNDITKERLELLTSYPVNRINIGIQSFSREKLAILNRHHNYKTVKKAVRLLNAYNIKHIGCDIIYGIGRDSWGRVKSDIKKVLKLHFSHMSLYSLIIEEKTVLKYLLNKGEYRPCSEEKEAAIYRNICRFLRKKGFIHYEISNFARAGHKAKHNLTYWNNGHYIGIGAGAAGYYNNFRYVNVKNLERYFKGISSGQPVYEEQELLSAADIMKEEMILGLRKTTGIDIESFENKYKINPVKIFPFIDELLEKGLLAIKHGHIFIPERQLYLSNEALIKFI